MKSKTQFVCQSCGTVSPRWQGKCHDCGEWNSYVEETIDVLPIEGRVKFSHELGTEKTGLVSIADISSELGKNRLKTNISELDNVLGGGIVSGMFILLAGDPGIGKSTLVMQICKNLNIQNKNTIYVTGEESLSQIKLRSERLKAAHKNLKVISEISFDRILDLIKSEPCDLLIVDSIQTLATAEISGTPGSVSQIREVAARFMVLAKSKNIPVILVGHVTKEGMIAGPKVLEHMVDTVLYFEGDGSNQLRILRCVKKQIRGN